MSPKSAETTSLVTQPGSEAISGPLKKNHPLCHPLLLEGVLISERLSNFSPVFDGYLLKALNPFSRDWPIL